MQKANDIHTALRFHLEVTSSAGPHALMAHQGALAEQLDSIQIHVCAVQHQLHFAKRPLTERAHNDVLIHECDALQHLSCHVISCHT